MPDSPDVSARVEALIVKHEANVYPLDKGEIGELVAELRSLALQAEEAQRKGEAWERESRKAVRLANREREAAEQRVGELEAALREIEDTEWYGFVGRDRYLTAPEVTPNDIARRALAPATPEKVGWAEWCPACKGYEDQQHRFDRTCDATPEEPT